MSIEHQQPRVPAIKEGKLVVEYLDKKYHLVPIGDLKEKVFIDDEGNESPQLNLIVGKFEATEMSKHSLIDYWWESKYSLANRAMKESGVKVLEFIDEAYPTYDAEGNPILY